MSHGYIYILTNPAFDGLVKLGSTAFCAAARAKQLSAATAVPQPFAVAYERYVNHFREFEKELHSKLSTYRVNPKREFFNLSVESAMETITNMAETPFYRPEDHYEAVEILPRMLDRYGENIRSDIVSVKIYQEIDRVYIETTAYKYVADYLKDQYIHRADLGFIVEWADKDHDAPIFQATDAIEANVKKFMALDDVSMANCVGQVFVSNWSPRR